VILRLLYLIFRFVPPQRERATHPGEG